MIKLFGNNSYYLGVNYKALFCYVRITQLLITIIFYHVSNTEYIRRVIVTHLLEERNSLVKGDI